jgi:hypothetical protein
MKEIEGWQQTHQQLTAANAMLEQAIKQLNYNHAAELKMRDDYIGSLRNRIHVMPPQQSFLQQHSIYRQAPSVPAVPLAQYAAKPQSNSNISHP